MPVLEHGVAAPPEAPAPEEPAPLEEPAAPELAPEDAPELAPDEAPELAPPPPSPWPGPDEVVLAPLHPNPIASANETPTHVLSAFMLLLCSECGRLGLG